MSFAPSDFKFALGVGAAGAYVDVTTDVLWDNSITRSWGTQSQFTPVSPGVYQLTLDNRTGKYSPDNPASTLATLLGEGTLVNWSLNGQQRAGQVRALQPIFTDIGVPAASAQMRVTVTDMLGVAALTTMGNLAYSAALANAYAFWPLNDAAGSGQGAEATGKGLPLVPSLVSAAFGSAGVPATSETQLFLSTAAPGSVLQVKSAVAPTPTLPLGSLGFLNSWIAPEPLTGQAGVGITSTSAGTTELSMSISVQVFSSIPTVSVNVNYVGFASAGIGSIAVPPGENFFSLGASFTPTSGASTLTVTLYCNGAVLGTGTSSGTVGTFVSGAGYSAFLTGGLSATGPDSFSHLSWTPTQVHEEAAGISTEAARLVAIAQTTPQVALASLPTDLSLAPIGIAATSGQSTLDGLVSVINTEQGYIDTATTGTLLAPVQTIRVRARQRPVTPAATWSVASDLTGAPEFARSLNDEVSTAKATGSTGTFASYTNPALIPRVASANTSDTLLTFQPSDLYEWASDRVFRGIKRLTDVTSITLDARGGTTTLWATLTSLAPGDRIHLTGFPVAQLGYSTWDGFLIGGSETHISQAQSLFTLYLAPCPPSTGVYDTDLLMNGGNCLISTTLTSGATSLVVNSTDTVTWFEGTSVGYYLLIDSEVVKVTAAAAPSAGTQTLTITRGQLSTTAAGHAIGAAPEVYADSTGRLNNGVIAF